MYNKKIEEFIQRREQIMELGGTAKISKQHQAGKLTCRERLDLLFDEGTFVEIGMFVDHRCQDLGLDKAYTPADGIITGFGKVNGRQTYAYAYDFTVLGGAMGEMGGYKVERLMKEAIMTGCPVVALIDSAGGRIQEHGNSTNYVFNQCVRGSGVVPQVSAIMGPCLGGAAYCQALTDFTIMTKHTSKMYITSTKVLKQVNGEEVDESYFGTAEYNAEVSGCVHRLAEDDYDCINQVKIFLSYLPQNCQEKPPAYAYTGSKSGNIPELNTIVPENLRRGYDVHNVINLIVDENSTYEIQPDWAKNIVTTLARLNGKSIGIIANQPMVMGGAIDINASDKMCHFITMCDAYNIPLLWLADVPGYLPGNKQESDGLIRHGAKALYANCLATVPKVRISMRKFFGGGKAAMCDKAEGLDYAISWPTCEEATMGGDGASQIIFANELRAAKAEGEDAYKAKLQECSEAFMRALDSPYFWAKNMWTDMIIMPEETRHLLIYIYETLESKNDILPQRKHTIFPV